MKKKIILKKDKEAYVKEVRARERILRIKGAEGRRLIDKVREVVGYNSEEDLEDLDIMTLENYIEELKKLD